MKSIHRQLLLNVVLGSQLLFLIWAIAFFYYTRYLFREQFDGTLAEKAQTFAHLCEVKRNEEIAFRFERLPLLEFQPSSPEAMYYQIRDFTGKIRTRSASLGSGILPVSETVPGVPTFDDITLPGGAKGRAVTLQFVVPPDNRNPPPGYDSENPAYRMHLTIARPKRPLTESQAVLFHGLFVFALALPFASFWVVTRAVRHGLHPLINLASQLSKIDPAHLTLRFGDALLPKELVPVVQHLNELLERVDRALHRERRLTANIAHELRTPIAELRVLAELELRGASKGETDDGRGDCLTDVLVIAQQMERQVHSLLELARCESGTTKVSTDHFDLIKLLRETSTHQFNGLLSRDIRYELHAPDELPVRSSPHLLSAILSNLFSNAVAYTPDGGVIRCEIRADSDQVAISLSNTTAGVDKADLKHFGEPFWRKEVSRSDGTHSGLGLSLVRSYAKLLGLDFSLELSDEGWLVASLRIPLAAGLDFPRARTIRSEDSVIM